ncbi:P-loop NTPase [Parendozoicomonas haliclonae]|uniref:Flagellum site-determining protein YlxH n=1 Tax=Parendozoicomonas haliclonae TaxID=1960125 RepID=A0A1X7AJP1_9GAMM|nr:P-loop NTPase [Parendozoicomonas haliclonae]SMA41940.1 Flagellum site-determining protein YlxH [Parendozoicomonas haliclonae]
MESKPARVIAIASGKGGVGKSFLTLNLGEALTRMGKRVAILDADFGLANIELLAGSEPDRTISDVLLGTCSIQETFIETPDGLRIIPGCRSNPDIAELSVQHISGLIHAVDELAGEIDYLLIDTSGGLSPTDLHLIRAAGEVLVVVTPDPMAQADAADYISALRSSCGIQHFGVLTNMTRRQREGHTLMEALQERLGFDQDLVLRHCGQVPYDQEMARQSDCSQTLFSDREDSRTARSLQMLAETLNRRRIGYPAPGGMAFFLEQTVSAGGI